MPTTQQDFDALQTALKTGHTQHVRKLLQNFDVTATNDNGTTCLMFASCYSSSPEIVKLVFDKIVEAGDTALLKSQLTATASNGWNCLMFASCYSSSPEAVKLVFDKIVEVGDTALLKSQLAATDSQGWTCLMLGCSWSRSPEVVKLIFDKIVEAGDTALLKSQLTATNRDGWTCLMLACANSSSPEVMKLVFEKIVEAGDTALLKSQLTAATNKGSTCLTLACMNSSSPEVVKLVLDKFVEAGDTALLKSQFTAINKEGHTCLMRCCGNSSSPEVVKLVFEKIVEAGDTALLKSQFSATDSKDWTCLMHVCSNSSSPEIVKLVFDKIVEAGDTALLKSQLTAISDSGRNCLMLCCINCKSPEVMKLVFEKIVEAGDTALLKSQLTATTKKGSTCLDLASWNSLSPEVLQLLAGVLFELALFKEQYTKLNDDGSKKLKEKTGIDSSSWAPDAASLAEVKAILRGPASAKKAQDEAAKQAAKKKAEEEAAKQAQSQQQPNVQQQQIQSSVTFGSAPPSRCFKRGVPDKNLEDAVRALFSIKEAPSNRPDLDSWIPDKEDADNLLQYLKCNLADLKERPAIKKLIAENGLTDDDIKILHSYKIQNPYPVYLWLNGWLGGDRRDDFVKQNVAPFFVLLYRAMEKLTRVKTVANRAIKVNGIASLKNTYDNYEKVCAPEKTLSFWGFSSFSTKSDVINREEFVGKPSEEAIVYSCGALEGVDMEPFAPKGLKDESEILPLCPCVLEVVTTVKMGQKLVVAVKQADHSTFAYVAPK